MRFLTGLVLGFILAIGVAWVHDTGVDPNAPQPEAARIVNWPVLASAFDTMGTQLRLQWDALTSRKT
jgi:hypothetical protein